MGFVEAIKDGFGKYATFSGRSSRSAYWYWVLFEVALIVVAAIIDVALGTQFILIIAWLAILIPTLAVGVRRLHDTGKTGWWMLISFIPFGGIVLLVFMCLESQGPNQYGQAPDSGQGTSAAFA